MLPHPVPVSDVPVYPFRRGQERQDPAYFSVMSVVGEGERLRMETELTEPWLTGTKAPN